MSRAPRTTMPGSNRSDEPTTFDDTEDVQRVLDVLDDAECRAILDATRDDPLTVGELADRCDLPQSTAYRKVDQLADADLLEESLRIRRSGKHVSEYACCVDDVTLDVGANEGIELTVSHSKPNTERVTPFQGTVADD
jgi:DNA-binding transcriptional ArsR family regulator